MQIVMAKDRPSLGEYVGRAAAEVLRRCISEKGGATLVVATGSSQFEVLESLVRQPDIDWSKVDGFHLDEYVGLSESHPASFCGYLAKRFVERVPLRSFYYLKGTRPAEQLRSEASAAIASRSIDLALVGIGENGHLAFNDPPADFATTEPYLIVELDEACRRQQVGEGWFDSLEQVPKQAISMSVQQILKAERIFCSVPDRRKAEAVRNSVEGGVTPLVPASILQQHPATELIIDEPAGMLLSAELLTAVHRLAS